MSVIPDAENNSKTQAYQTESGDTTKGAIIDTRRPNHDNVQAMTAMKGFGWKWIAVNDPCVWLILGSPMSRGEHLPKNNSYNKYKLYNTHNSYNWYHQ